MRIGINGYEAVVPRFGFDRKTGLPLRVGSGEVSFELLKYLSEIDNKNEYSVFLPVKPSADMPGESKNFKYVVFHAKKLWTLIGLSMKLKNYKLDVFFSPTHYLPFMTNAPSVISILDVSYLKFPQAFKRKDLYMLKYWGGFSIKKAKAIITISKSSRDDIIRSYHVPGDKVKVVYPGIKKDLRFKIKDLSMETLKKKFGIESPYILFVGTLQPRKNIIRLIEAFSLLKEQGIKNEELQLVVVGRKGWMYEEILDAPAKYNVREKVKFLDSVEDSDLPSLYKNALCFCLPSLYEGFGLPVLEAMQYGCPVVTSNVSSLPEAGGDAALYFDPENVQDIVRSLKLITENSKLREELIKKGYEQAAKFSWEKSAKQTLQILEEVAKK